MPYSQPVRIAPRRVRIRRSGLAGLLIVVVAIAAALGSPSGVSSPSTTATPEHPPRGAHRGPLGEADGAVPDGTTVFDADVPGVARLRPGLLHALRRAATDAEREGVGFVVNSGWRSSAYEEHLRREAIAKYGSEEEADRWVATGTTSPHVSGEAVDIGPAEATRWLSAHGAAYGLCQIYANEPWHYELRPEAVSHGCPAMYADPTEDPRLQHR